MLHLGPFRLINIIKLERVRVTMAAQDLIFLILLRLFSLPANTESTDVILAAVRDENVIEIS